jgi:hypothetical protein
MRFVLCRPSGPQCFLLEPNPDPVGAIPSRRFAPWQVRIAGMNPIYLTRRLSIVFDRSRKAHFTTKLLPYCP